MTWPDALRVICGLLGLLLTFSCVYSACRSNSYDQRMRFGGLAVIGFVVIAGQIDAWGRPGHWRMPLLALGLGLALTGTFVYLARMHRDLED